MYREQIHFLFSYFFFSITRLNVSEFMNLQFIGKPASLHNELTVSTDFYSARAFLLLKSILQVLYFLACQQTFIYNHKWLSGIMKCLLPSQDVNVFFYIFMIKFCAYTNSAKLLNLLNVLLKENNIYKASHGCCQFVNVMLSFWTQTIYRVISQFKSNHFREGTHFVLKFYFKHQILQIFNKKIGSPSYTQKLHFSLPGFLSVFYEFTNSSMGHF